MVGFLESLFHIADIDADVCGEILFGLRIRKVDVFRLIVDSNRVRLHRFARVEDGIQNFIFHVDQAQCLLGNFKSLRRNERDAVADESHFVIERKRIERTGDGIGLPGRGIHHAWNILPGQHSRNPFEFFGFARVDPFDAGVRVRRVQDFCVQHAAHIHIRGKGGLALHELDRVHFFLGLADGLPRLRLRRKDDLGARHHSGQLR